VLFQDITARKRAEEALQKLNETLEARVVEVVAERMREQERLKQAEEALRHSQKMEAVGQLTGGIAHDFNNLLTGIIGSLELLQARLSQGRLSEIDRYVAAAQGASKRAAALTHRLLAFSRRQTLDPKPTDVNRLVVGMEELIRRTVGPQITLDVVTAGGLWPALIDASQLEAALLNLCINARDAMPDGGRITIETANRWLDDSAAKERDLPGQYLSLCVSDTGSGMSPDIMARAFDPFFTTKPIGQGTGLGLSMVYGFVRQSGGQVQIYSEVGLGTNMRLYLARHYGSSAEIAPASERESVKRGRQCADRADCRRRADSADAGHRSFGRPWLCGNRGRGRPCRTKGAASRWCAGFAYHRCRPARRHERPPACRCRPPGPAGAAGAVHHRLCGERDHRQWAARSWHAGFDQAFRGRHAGAPHPGDDRTRGELKLTTPAS
jgi:signal transduction histidine kinase